MFRSLFHAIRGPAVGVFWCAAAAMPAHADTPAQIERLPVAEQPAESLARLDRLLAQRPQDPQLRFEKAVVLAQMQRRAEAMAALSELAADYPEIPEVHNNLAVLYAAQGDYEQARLALEAAVRANPGYAVAHHNLGDVHAQLARRSYEQALRLDPSNAALPRKLSLLRDAVHVPSGGTVSATRPPP
jgi:Flp pilus assembly protein TadD